MRTAAFLALVAGLFLLTLTQRGGGPVARLRRNPWLPRLLPGVGAMLALVLGVPWLGQVMGFTPPADTPHAAAAVMLAASAAWLALLRAITRRAGGRPARTAR